MVCKYFLQCTQKKLNCATVTVCIIMPATVQRLSSFLGNQPDVTFAQQFAQ